MQIMLIYFSIMGIGGFLGYKFSSITAKIPGLSTIQTACIYIILFFLGVQLGSDESIQDAITGMGLRGIGSSLLAMAFSFVLVLVIRTVLEKRGGKEQE